ncbi:MAG: tRNA (N(6)-L-threonylcarbamoyladenosine(37)-C(2))-methylthiotransferase MtaB [Candidatus Wallbacteria bacterium]
MYKFAIMTLGCKINQYEENLIASDFMNAGFERVEFKEPADVYIVNSCSVTAEAESKARQHLHRAARENSAAVIILSGCYATRLNGEKIDSVDLLIRQNEKKDLFKIFLDYIKNSGADSGSSYEKAELCRKISEYIATNPVKYDGNKEHKTCSRARTQIKIQDGCKNFCTYCIVPYIRNVEWSKSPDDVLNEINSALKIGYYEIVLSGIHIGKYKSADIYGQPLTFEDLLKMIDIYGYNGRARFRVSSIDPSEITEKIVNLIKFSDVFVPHFHVALQSGSDRILKLMNRHYTSAEFTDKINMIAKSLDNPAITSDVIVGFPGETEEDFENTRNILEKLPFYDFHIFQYSDRPGTKASAMNEKISPDVKKRRSETLHDLKKKKNLEYYQKLVGRVSYVIAEKTINSGGEVFLVGHSERYVETVFKGGEELIGKITKVKLTEISNINDGMRGIIEK